MRRFFSWVMRPWLLWLLVVLLLSLLIWFGAPLLAFDGWEMFASALLRQGMIAALLLIWAGYFLWKVFAWAGYFLWELLVAAAARLQLNASMDATDASAQAVPAAVVTDNPDMAADRAQITAGLDVLNQRMQAALAMLRKAGSNRFWGRQYLYELPWYLLIGAPGSGKTTALLQSGLKFPLADKIGKNVNGSSDDGSQCDWWFTDEAVLLDTPGRYTTQDSHAGVDQQIWCGFLDLLRKHRRRRPINGVIVAISVSDLLQQSSAARQAQALAIRARIKELHDRLGIRIPIYVVVTKCDLLAGFMEFFDHLGQDERAQVWGMTFPLIDAGQVDRRQAAFPAEFKALEARLQERLVKRMQQERDLKRRALLYGFPQQFSALEDMLGNLVDDVFESTRFEESALLRGVYFTSGTQEGTPVDRIVGALATAFQLNRQVLPANTASGRSYFVTRLMRDVMFKETGIAGVNQRHERQRRLVRWSATAAIGLVLALWSGALLTSYFRNLHYVADVAARMEHIEKLARALPATDAPLDGLPLLDAIRDLPGGHAERDAGVPWLNRFGLDQGDRLGGGAQVLYRRQLREVLLPRIVTRMETELSHGSTADPEYLYELLRAYLMLNDRKHLDPESVLAWTDMDWRRHLQEASETQREALSGHAGVLLASLDQQEAPVRLDAALIARTRLALARLPLPQRIYNRVKHEIARTKLAEFSITSGAGQDVSQVFVRRSGEPLTRGIPGMFTLAGFDKFSEAVPKALIDITRDNWVLAQQESALTLNNAMQTRALVQQLYYDDYIRQWDMLLADLTVVPLTSLDQSARVTNILSSPESPLRKFLQAVARETTLEAASARKIAAASATTLVKRKLDAAKSRLESTLSTSIDQPQPSAAASINPVDMHFAILHRFVGTPGAVAAAPIEQLLQLLKEVSAYFDAADSARKSGLPPPVPDALTRLQREADGKPAPLGAILKATAGGGGGLAQGSERVRLNALWVAAGPQFCRQAIAGRYPLVRGATQEVTLEDFGKFFGPGGVMDDFFQKNLASHVDMGGGQWRWRKSGPAALGIGQDVLDEFQRAARLREMFFAGGAHQPSMRFSMQLIMVDASLKKLLLDIDGQPVNYIAGKPAPMAQLQVPSGKGTGQVRFEAEPAGTRPDPKTDGPWAWFRMMDKNTLTGSPQGEHYRMKVDLDGRIAVYDLTASSVINPFKRDVLERFRCVERL